MTYGTEIEIYYTEHAISGVKGWVSMKQTGPSSNPQPDGKGY